MYLLMKSVSCSMYIFVFLEYSKSMTAPSGVVEHPIVSSAASKVMAGRVRGKVALITRARSGLGAGAGRPVAPAGGRGPRVGPPRRGAQGKARRGRAAGRGAGPRGSRGTAP